MFLTNPWLFFKNVRLRADTAALTITPRPSTVTRQRLLKATARAVTITPQSATMSRTRAILAGSAAIAVTGSAGLNRQLLLRAQPVVVDLSTTLTVMERSRLAGFIKTEVTIAPKTAQLKLGRVIKAQQATVSLSPKAANFLKVAANIQAVTKAMAVAPGAVNLRAERLLLPSRSEIIVAPKQVLLRRDYPLIAAPAILTLLQQEAKLLRQRQLAAVNAAVALAGNSADLIYKQTAHLTFKGLFTDLANGSSYGSNAQWQNLDLGPEAPDRAVLFIIFGQGGGDSITAATFGGSSLLPAVRHDNRLTICIKSMPTGASGNLAVSFSASQTRAGFAYWVVNGLESVVPYSVNGVQSGSPSTKTTTADVKAGGLVIVAGYEGATAAIAVNGGTHTAEFSTLVESAVYMAGGFLLPTADETARSFSYTNVHEMSVASWR